mmetsp:Transcript_19830/g.30049  ORF Transcript_19830/g.30049 Transcript_19830/m.30049 type:complete len:85 (+) Transcript_19830:281-535(+)
MEAKPKEYAVVINASRPALMIENAKPEEAVIRTRQHDNDCDSLSGQVVRICSIFFFQFLSLSLSLFLGFSEVAQRLDLKPSLAI